MKKGEEIYPIKRGEFVMIRGPSGGGKTTLLNQIGTIDTASQGIISFNIIHLCRDNGIGSKY